MTSTRLPTFPTPVRRTPDSAAFFDAAGGGVLLLQRCIECGTARGPQHRACPTCQSAAADPLPAAGTGHIVSWSTVHRSPLPDVAGPYVVVIVELTEGPWLLLRLLDATDGTDGRLRLDQDVELVALPSGTDREHAGETLFAARITGTRQ